nr:hypothetical protein [Tanacetum cinerariifolium]
LEDITYSDDEDDVGAEADFNNLETSITVSPIPTIRLHKDYPVSQIIGDLSLTTQTRSMTRVVQDQSGLSQMCNDNFHTSRLVTQGHTQEEGINYEEVFTPVPDNPDKVYKVVKALYGLHQAPRAWYETLANYLLENSFQRGKIDETLFIKRQKGDILLVQMYVDDIIFGATNKDLCKSFEKLMKDKFQMSSMGELTFFLGLQCKKQTVIATSSTETEYVVAAGFEDLENPDKVYKVAKALYGLHQAPRAWYETLANYIQENGFQRGKIDQTLLIKRQKGDILLVQIYVDDIIFGTTNKDLCKSFEKLMKDKFQMSSMGELTFFLCL